MTVRTIIKLIIIISFMSILNFNNASANYEKIIFDFKVTDISGKEINLNKKKVTKLKNSFHHKQEIHFLAKIFVLLNNQFQNSY